MGNHGQFRGHDLYLAEKGWWLGLKEVIVETQKPGEGLLGKWNQWLLLKDWKEQRGNKGIRGHSYF